MASTSGKRELIASREEMSVPVPAPAAGAATDGVPVRLKGRLAQAGVTEGLEIAERKPDWLRSTFRTDPSYLRLKHTMRDLGLVTVCEEAGCPNIYECWGQTAPPRS